MRIPFCCLLSIATAVGAVAQNDTIKWTDGTMTKNVTVTGFTLNEVSFKSSSGSESRSTARVAELEVAKIKDKYRRAYAAPRSERVDTFLSLAESLKSDPFVSQFGYAEAAKMLLDNQDFSDAFQILEEMEKACPNSGYKPLRFRAKLDYYLARDKKADFAALATKYETATQVEAYPEGFAIEAAYYRTLARALAGELSHDQLRKEMATLAGRADRKYPDIAARARIAIADALRLEGKIPDATREYKELVEDPKIAPTVLSSAWLGLGHCYSAAGTPANKDPYRDALLSFLRVYLDEAAPESLKAESLYYGAQAAGKWGGESASFYRRVLRGRLLNHYADSPWAKK